MFNLLIIIFIYFIFLKDLKTVFINFSLGFTIIEKEIISILFE